MTRNEGMEYKGRARCYGLVMDLQISVERLDDTWVCKITIIATTWHVLSSFEVEVRTLRRESEHLSGNHPKHGQG